jgi:uncharacterized DUF497 family protein
VRRFRWNPDKNEALKGERGISFERVVLAIEDGAVLDVLHHPNEGRYPGQRILVVAVEGYAYLVPYVEEPDGDGYFLKTVIPSRKATRAYLGRGEADEED